jgi:hypothetical protein
VFESDAPATTFDGDQGRQKKPKSTYNWSLHTVDELVRFRDEITKHLPPLELKDLDMEEEVILQYHTLRSLQGNALDDTDFPLNQRVQLANSVNSCLAKMTEIQNELFSSERFKRIENVLIRQLSKLPEDVAAAFIAEYETALRS